MIVAAFKATVNPATISLKFLLNDLWTKDFLYKVQKGLLGSYLTEGFLIIVFL